MNGGDSPDARPGVRSNALPASTFTRLRVVDARVSDALLDVLEDAGVAAYVEPSAGEVGPYRDVHAHSAPSDQLYVDVATRDIAATVIDAELPGMLAELELNPAQQDDAFAAIVAGFDAPAPGETEWPDAESSTAPATDTTEHDDDWYAVRAMPDPDDEEHFVPGPPPPLPRLTGGKLWGVVMLVGGFLLMPLLPLLDFSSDDSIAIGVVVMAAGAATLVWWMREDRSDSDPDDGAVV